MSQDQSQLADGGHDPEQPGSQQQQQQQPQASAGGGRGADSALKYLRLWEQRRAADTPHDPQDDPE